MRRKEREVTDYNQMLGIVDKCDCLRLGFVDGEDAYIVPLNYGYEDNGGNLILYCHGAKEGRKADLIKSNGRASFEMDTKHELVGSDTACSYSYMYQSVIGKGDIKFIESYEEKKHALELIMAHYTEGKEWQFNENMVNSVAVMKLSVKKWTAKEH